MKQLQWRLSCALIVNFKRGGPSAKSDFMMPMFQLSVMLSSIPP